MFGTKGLRKVLKPMKQEVKRGWESTYWRASCFVGLLFTVIEVVKCRVKRTSSVTKRDECVILIYMKVFYFWRLKNKMLQEWAFCFHRICPRVTTREWLNEFSWNLIVESLNEILSTLPILVGADGRLILNCISKKQGMGVFYRFTWLRI
jgi:hypothetical protein